MDYDDAKNNFHDVINRYQVTTVSHGIYTHNDNSYSFIFIDNGVIRAAGLSFSEPGTDLHEKYQARYPNPSVRSTTPGDVSTQLSFEAYVMSQALYYSTPIQIGTYDALVGSTFYYGWHFNWRGDKATICTHETLMSGEFNVLGGQLRRYNMTIVEDNEGYLTASVALMEEDRAQLTTAEFILWTPQRNSAGNEQTPSSWDTCGFKYYDDDYGRTSFKAPCYSFYSADDREIVVYLYKTVGEGMTYEEAQTQALTDACPNVFQFSGYGSGGATGDGRAAVDEFGVEIDGVKYGVTDNHGGGYYIDRFCSVEAGGADTTIGCHNGWNSANLSIWTQSDVEVECYYPPPDGAYQCYNCGPIFEVECGTLAYSSEVRTTGTPGVGSLSGELLLIIPYRSMESVMVVTSQRVREDYQLETRSGTTYAKMRQVLRSPTHGAPWPGKDWAGFVWPWGACGLQDTISTQHEVVGGDGGCSHQQDQDFVSTTIDNRHLKRWIVTPFEATKTDDYTEPTSNNYGAYLPYFGPPICTSLADTNGAVNIGSVFGHSVRTETENTPRTGTNCNITTEQTSPNGFWTGWA